MSTTTSSLESTQIADFAAGVRAALADLPAEDVEELTDGLEADLAESLAEDLRRTLPDPVAYAAELRLAAGLPGPTTRPGTSVLAAAAEAGRRVRGDLGEVVQRNPTLAAVAGFSAELRPVWWVARAWIATWLLAAFFGMERELWFDGGWWIVLVVLAVVSVQWGRGRWGFSGRQGLVAVGNVVAVLALLPMMGAATEGDNGGYDAGYADGAGQVPIGGEGDGLFFDGHPLDNIYVYDAAGNPLSGVQLFDVDGKPLVPYRDADVTGVLQTPATLETGVQAYNVYPLVVARAMRDENGELVPDPDPDPDKAAAYANGPFLKVPAVQAPAPAAPAASPAPTDTVAEPNH
jgi:hypothetical protein